MINTPDKKNNDQVNAMKKKILKVFAILGAGMLIMFAMLYVLSLDFDEFLYDEISSEAPASTPYPVDFEEDIFKDPEYMELDRLMYFSDYRVYQDGSSISIDFENYTKYGEEAAFMYEFLQSIINGDDAFYNSCFNDKYIEAEGKHGPFTMQKLHNIKIRLMQIGETNDGSEFAYVRLEYSIFKNNHTFRDDISGNYTRTQFLTLIKDSHDHYKIQAIQTLKAQPQKVLNVVNLVFVIFVAIAVGAAIVVCIIFILKKDKNKKRAKKLSKNVPDTEHTASEAPANNETDPKREE